jgi:predicted methyltransferase
MKLKLSANFRALLLLLTGACLIGGNAQADTAPSVAVVAAVADRDRPESDRNRDSARKPAETLQFSGIKPGDAVADFNAGSGYFTRLFSDVVGKHGHVYAI